MKHLYDFGTGEYCEFSWALRKLRDFSYCKMASCGGLGLFDGTYRMSFYCGTPSVIEGWASAEARSWFAQACLKKAVFEAFNPMEGALAVATIRNKTAGKDGLTPFYLALGEVYGSSERDGSLAQELCRAYCVAGISPFDMAVFGRMDFEDVFWKKFLNDEEG